jgi:hypothetical protein
MFRTRPVLGGLLFALLMPLGGRMASAQEFPKEPDRELVPLEEKVVQFLNGVSAGEAQTAYQALLAGSRLAAPDKAEAFKKLVETTDELEKKFGPFREFEQIGSKRVGKDLVLLKYLYKCEQFPVLWYFAFYRPPSAGETANDNAAWRVVSVRFDTKLELLWF